MAFPAICNATGLCRMKILKIYTDLAMDGTALKLLKDGVAPHQIALPARPAESVLAKSDPGPALMDADIAFGQPDAAGVLHAPRLRWLQVSSAGITRYDTAEFRAASAARGLAVTNSSTVYAEPCAEHVFAFMLAQARRLPAALQSRSTNGSPAWLELRGACTLLRNQEVLMLGFGAIAAHLLEMLRPFGMRITALRRKATGDEGVVIISAEQLPAALAKADHIVNLLPDSSSSRHFVSAPQFAAMKPGAVFYNIGRGATVDQDALVAALQSGHLAAAWLDVTEPEPLPSGHPLLSAPNCFITPHTAGGHHHETESLVRHFLENFRRFLEGDALRDRVM
jgi:phosphoglycerate dehydrogenase-like enzyme